MSAASRSRCAVPRHTPTAHDTRSVFGDFDDMRRTNPLGRIPSLSLDSGETLNDSAAILDHIDEDRRPCSALSHSAQRPRHRAALRRIALATGIIDKAGGGVVYERLVRPAQYRWPDWIARCRTQAVDALAALDAAKTGRSGISFDQSQAEITTGAALYYR